MPFHERIERLISQPAPRMEEWCDWEGKPSDQATQYSLIILSDVRHGRLTVSASYVIFPDPEKFNN